jgi:predicted enzyme related to lactoylglutathione lyase
MAKHSFCHIEWLSTDLERTKTFLSGLFGWQFKPWGSEYLVFSPPKGPGGGIMKAKEVHSGESPSVYVEVDEIEPYLEKAKQFGGDVGVGKTEIPGAGWFAHLIDPDGNIVGVFEGRKAK